MASLFGSQGGSGSSQEEEYDPSEYQFIESARNRVYFHVPGKSYAALHHSCALISRVTEIPTPPPQA